MELLGHIVACRYEVKQSLQSGFYGQTWLAQDRTSGIYVCLKTFFSENTSQRRELKVLKQLCDGHFKHEHLCHVIDVCLDRASVATESGILRGSIQYVVFEYCSGSDMFNFLCTGPCEKIGRVSNFSDAIARHYFKQVVLGVTYLHERGVFHRDIKPENCVLDDNLNLKLTDFGTNKIVPQPNPMQLLRTKTRGVGTESYRAPEVNSGLEYDPAAADVWSLGVMLFFFVGVEQMWSKAQSLDHYSKQILAPLGTYFPFPIHCPKLDSYLRRELELRGRGITGGIRGLALPNELFWSEWQSLKEIISPELRDLFNRIFVLEPSLRMSLRDLIRHPWMTIIDGLSPEIVHAEMKQRCPESVRMCKEASPKVLPSKLLGGVDQAVLRESLSGSGREDVEFPEDSEVWAWSINLQHLESILLNLVGQDIQELIMDMQLSCELIRNILTHPVSEDHRTVYLSNIIRTEWIVQFLLVLGFLPQGHTLFLTDENLNLSLLSAAIVFLQGVELAVSRSAIITTSDENEADINDEEEDVMEMEDEVSLEDQIDNGDISNNGVTNGGGVEGTGENGNFLLPVFGKRIMRSFSGNEDHSGSFETPIGSSQGSFVWTTMSSQSSQEELPESLQIAHDWYADFSTVHRFINLATPVNIKSPKQYKAASEFCKLSGLLCSYGVYQVVCHEQLALYCRGNSASFSLRLVHLPNPEANICMACISTWCFSGPDEWIVILERLSNDMLQSK